MVSNTELDLNEASEIKIVWDATKAYVLADKLGCKYLENAILNFHRSAHFLTTPELLLSVYDNTSMGFQFREYIICTAQMTFFTREDAINSHCLEFTKEYMKAIDKHIVTERCRYYNCKVHDLDGFRA